MSLEETFHSAKNRERWRSTLKTQGARKCRHGNDRKREGGSRRSAHNTNVRNTLWLALISHRSMFTVAELCRLCDLSDRDGCKKTETEAVQAQTALKLDPSGMFFFASQFMRRPTGYRFPLAIGSHLCDGTRKKNKKKKQKLDPKEIYCLSELGSVRHQCMGNFLFASRASISISDANLLWKPIQCASTSAA